MAVKFPKVKLNFDAKTIEQLDKPAPSGQQYFRDGIYECVIESAKDLGPSKHPSFAGYNQWEVNLKGVGGQTKKMWISIPFGSISKQGPFYGFRSYCRGVLGVELTSKNVQETVVKYFLNPEKHVGLHSKVTFHFDGVHAKGSKNESKKLYNVKGEVMLDAAGNELVFDDFKAAEAYANQQSFTYASFATVKYWNKSDTANTEKMKAFDVVTLGDGTEDPLEDEEG